MNVDNHARPLKFNSLITINSMTVMMVGYIRSSMSGFFPSFWPETGRTLTKVNTETPIGKIG